MSELPTPASEPSSEVSVDLNSTQPPHPRFVGPLGKVLLIWNRVAPFFVSAALFLSGFFAIFSPLPFLILGITSSGWWVAFALVTNASLVYVSSGPTVFQFYLLSIATIGIVMPFLIRRRFQPEQIIARTWIVQWCLVGILICVYALLHHVTPLTELRRVFSNFFDILLQSLTPEAREQLVSKFGGDAAVGGASLPANLAAIDEWRRQTLSELPGVLGILCLLVSWFNLRLLVNLNPNRLMSQAGLDRQVLNRWKNADWLIWPTLGVWAVVLFTNGLVSDIALNAFKILMAAYGLQGLGVLGSLFDAWKIRGIFRLVLYALIVFVMMPLLLSIGFFDQWFDFRAKFRQS